MRNDDGDLLRLFLTHGVDPNEPNNRSWGTMRKGLLSFANLEVLMGMNPLTQYTQPHNKVKGDALKLS